MANTFTQLYVHIVFAVKGRQNLISANNREELHKYITGIVRGKGQKMIAIFCMPDHLHMFVGMMPDMSVSDLVRDVKANASKFINTQQWVLGKFSWQEGFGAFSYAQSQQDVVVNYILKQKEHHKTKTFKEEYLDILKKFEVDYDERYLFEWIDVD